MRLPALVAAVLCATLASPIAANCHRDGPPDLYSSSPETVLAACPGMDAFPLPRVINETEQKTPMNATALNHIPGCKLPACRAALEKAIGAISDCAPFALMMKHNYKLMVTLCDRTTTGPLSNADLMALLSTPMPNVTDSDSGSHDKSDVTTPPLTQPATSSPAATTSTVSKSPVPSASQASAQHPSAVGVGAAAAIALLIHT